jgi:plastocyanin
MLKRILTTAVVIAALGTSLAACGGYGDDSSPSAAAQAPAADGTTKVSVQDNQFKPADIKVKSGDTVTFTNDGAVAHTVTATDGADFDSGTLAPGKTFSFVAAGHGTITYVCTIHPGMQGTVEVD